MGQDVLSGIGRLIVDRLEAERAEAVVLVTDEHVSEIHGPAALEALRSSGFRVTEFRLKPGETSKSLAVAEQLYRCLSDNEIGRDGMIVALGGGVVSDLAGFVAGTWARGIRFAICPTTLEADVDASIGGKTAVNISGGGKNLVGAFHQPILVAIDPSCLSTLGQRDIQAGMAESIKHALISSGEFLNWHEVNSEGILSLEPETINELIRRNVRIKGGIVERDPYEQGEARMMLNLGHTIGHAIEACCGYALRHGECVSLGTLAACRLSERLGMLSMDAVSRVEGLLTQFGLPTELAEPIDPDKILCALRRDKKARAGKVQFVLLEDVGMPVVRRDVSERSVREAYESLLP